jgi:hypothetical protein
MEEAVAAVLRARFWSVVGDPEEVAHGEALGNGEAGEGETVQARNGFVHVPRAEMPGLLDAVGEIRRSGTAAEDGGNARATDSSSRHAEEELLAKTLAWMARRGEMQFPWKRLCMRDSEAGEPGDEGTSADDDRNSVEDSPDIAGQFVSLQQFVPVISHKPRRIPNIGFVTGQRQTEHPRVSIDKTLHLEARDLSRMCRGRDSSPRAYTFVSKDSDYFATDILTDWFSEKPRMNARRQDEKRSPAALWRSPDLQNLLVGVIRRRSWPDAISRNHPGAFRAQLENCDVTAYTIREELYSRRGVKEATTFKSNYAATIYRLFGSSWPDDLVPTDCAEKPSHELAALPRLDCSRSRILDISAGWGDRLLAAMAVDAEAYVAVDPNPDLEPCHRAIMDRFANKVAHPDNYCVFRDGFERIPVDVLRRAASGPVHSECSATRRSDIAAVSEHTEPSEPGDPCPYDIAFSSPPFFNFELYNEQASDGQSHVSFPQERQWLIGFLFTSLSKCWTVLRFGGVMAIHIVDVYRQKVCLAMCLFVEAYLGGSRYAGIFGSVSDTSDKLRPCWVWEKSQRVDPVRRQAAEKDLESFYGHEFVASARSIAQTYEVMDAIDLTRVLVTQHQLRNSAQAVISNDPIELDDSLCDIGFEFEPPQSPLRNAYTVTIANLQELPAALVLGFSLRKHCTIDAASGGADLVCLLATRPPDFVVRALRRVFGRVLLVPELRPDSRDYDRPACSKVSVLRLVEYGRVVCLDSNAVVLRDISNLFEMRSPSGVCDLLENWDGEMISRDEFSRAMRDGRGMHGCLVLKPDDGDFTEVLARIRNAEYGLSGASPDDEVLSLFFERRWNPIDPAFGGWARSATAGAVVRFRGPLPLSDDPHVSQWDELASELLSSHGDLAPLFPNVRGLPGCGIEVCEPPRPILPSSHQRSSEPSERPPKRRRGGRW